MVLAHYVGPFTCSTSNQLASSGWRVAVGGPGCQCAFCLRSTSPVDLKQDSLCLRLRLPNLELILLYVDRRYGSPADWNQLMKVVEEEFSDLGVSYLAFEGTRQQC